MGDAPLWLRELLNQLFINHPKVMSGISTVLVTAGGVVLIPGIFDGTVLAHPAVKVGGAITIAVAFGRWPEDRSRFRRRQCHEPGTSG
jgi:hypothetical protein